MPPAVIAVGMMAAVSASMAVMQGIQQHKGAEDQKIEEQQQAKVATFSANQQINQQDYEANQTLARIRASAGAAGVDSSGGSVKVDTDTSANNARLNDIYTKFSGNFASSQELYKGSIAQYQGNQDEAAGFMSAGKTILSSATTITAPTSAGGLGYNPFASS
jgi:hypothetical protein